MECPGRCVRFRLLHILKELLLLGLFGVYCSTSAQSRETLKNNTVIRLKLTDVRGHGLAETLRGDELRFKSIESSISVADKTSTREGLWPGLRIGTVNYIVQIGFGTPARKFSLLMDTGSDITWIQCAPCNDCHSQAEKLFDPANSHTYTSLPCHSTPCAQLQGFRPSCTEPGSSSCTYHAFYNDRSATAGDFAAENVTMGTDMLGGFAFGCAHTTSGGLFGGAAGILGLGRSPLSFPSQTADIYGEIFSYCLPTFGGGGWSVGSLFFGHGSVLARNVYFVPLVINSGNPFYYYIRLTGLSVGGKALEISPRVFDFGPRGEGGVIIDSGTLVTRLVQPVYTALRDAFRNRTGNIPLAPAESIFDTCYRIEKSESVEIPSVGLLFETGVEVILPSKNVLIRMYDEGTTMCLAFAPTSDVSSKELSIIGSFQQQDLRVVYDPRNSRLGFATQQCDSDEA